MSKPNKRFQPHVEKLEERALLSWGSTVPAVLNLTAPGNDRYVITNFGNDATYTKTDAITRGEVDLRRFTAPRTGTYTFEARAAGGSSIDTVTALFSDVGKRLAYNDDATPTTHNSKFTYPLVAGH